MPTDDMERVWNIEIRERLAKLEQRVDDADKALGVATQSVSLNLLFSVFSIIVSVIAIAVAWLIHK